MTKIYFTKEDLRGKYMDCWDCPIFRALKRTGNPVCSVGGDYWSCNNWEYHKLKRSGPAWVTFVAPIQMFFGLKPYFLTS